MQALPHRYQLSASSLAEGHLQLSAPGLPDLQAAAPAEFDGPGDQWSPEALFMASVASCFILSFRAISSISTFDWLKLECAAEGVLDKQERKICFTEVALKASLTLAEDGDADKARKLLEKAEQNCLISNSLLCPVHLQIEIIRA